LRGSGMMLRCRLIRYAPTLELEIMMPWNDARNRVESEQQELAAEWAAVKAYVGEAGLGRRSD
jgi:hypothetical protein